MYGGTIASRLSLAIVVNEALHKALLVSKTHQRTIMTIATQQEFLRVKKLSDKATLPTRGSPLSAGHDLYR
jgi:hypothetical protein